MRASRAPSPVMALYTLSIAVVFACAIVLLVITHHSGVPTAVIYGILIVTPWLYLFIIELEELEQVLKHSDKREVS